MNSRSLTLIARLRHVWAAGAALGRAGFPSFLRAGGITFRVGMLGDVNVSDDGALCGLDPLAVLGDLREDAHGAEDSSGCERGFVDAFENAFGDATKIEAAALEQAGGRGVTVNGRARRELIIDGDGGLGAPTDEVVVDGGTVGMVANGAFAGVAREAGGSLLWRARAIRFG
ncbi:MAG: hypothetical protein WA020_01510 [Candidatus Acidiferrales bacterium]